MSIVDEIDRNRLPRHVAIIMDGNGRWAKQKHLDRSQGHVEGVKAVRRVTEIASELGIGYLTLYTFSTENWKRDKEEIDGIQIITHLAKGMNPIACSRVFDYVRKYEGNKVVILLLDDLHEAASGSENTAWQYDTDYEFLNDDSIKQIILAGVRYLDGYVRLQMAGIDKNKILYQRDEISALDKLKLDDIKTVFILHDLYSMELKEAAKKKIETMIRNEKDNIKE